MSKMSALSGVFYGDYIGGYYNPYKTTLYYYYI